MNENTVPGCQNFQRSVTLYSQVTVANNNAVGNTIACKDHEINQILSLYADGQRIVAVDACVVIVGHLLIIVVISCVKMPHTVVGKVVQCQYTVQKMRISTLGLLRGNATVVIKVVTVREYRTADQHQILKLVGRIVILNIGDGNRLGIGHGIAVDHHDLIPITCVTLHHRHLLLGSSCGSRDTNFLFAINSGVFQRLSVNRIGNGNRNRGIDSVNGNVLSIHTDWCRYRLLGRLYDGDVEQAFGN